MNEQSLNTVVDESIILRIAGGDKSALSMLYLNTKNAVYCFALSILRNKETAQDVMQDTYIQVWNSAKNYKPTKKNPMPWILGVTKFLAYAELRKQQHMSDYNDSLLETEDSKDCFYDCENKLITNALLTKLKSDERQIVILHIMAGLKHREIAKLLDTPISTVINKYNRSLKKLEKLAGYVI